MMESEKKHLESEGETSDGDRGLFVMMVCNDIERDVRAPNPV